MNPPRIFISYSHDSAEHKKWVLDFATTLRNRGVDAVLDQWDLRPGDDLPHFMETQLALAKHIVMICTEKYVKKANAGEGGVGYEKMIMTSNLMQKIDGNKVIPVIRQGGSENTPTFLNTKLYINFSRDEDIEYQFDELLRVILDAPLYEKPKIGENPFKPMENSRPDRTADGVKEVMKTVAKCYENNSDDSIWYSNMIHMTSMHRLILDKYIGEAVTKNLISWDTEETIVITPNGIQYLESHNIING